MAVKAVGFDTEADAGERLDSAVRAEIILVSPSTLDDGDVKTNMLADLAVTTPKIALGAVGSPQIATKGVKTVNIDDAAVGTPQLADGAVTGAKTGTGVVTAYDSMGNLIDSKEVYLSAADYDAIPTPDPNTTYYVSA